MGDRIVVVTDGDERASLAAVRSLGAAGWIVHVVACRKRSLAAASRWAAESHVARPPLADPLGFHEDLRGIVEAARPDVLLPIAEPALLALGDDRSPFAPAAVPFPPLATIRRAADKAEVARLAAGLGVAVPQTLALDAPRPLDTATLDALRFPVVLKPARSVRPDTAPGAKFTVTYADDASALAAAIEALPAGAFPLLLQDRVRGPGVGVFLLMDRGEILASFAHRRIRERPPSGGVSVCRESVILPVDLRASAAGLLRALDLSGVAMVEFKLDEATGRGYLMEVNPRLWGSLQLAIDAGVDFPALLADWALGERPAAEPEYEPGVRSRWLWGEADHLIARTRAGFSRGPRAALAEALTCLSEQFGDRGPRTKLEILRRADPKPFLWESARWIGDVLR